MKKLFTFILFLIASANLACECDEWKLDEAFRNSSFVATGKIISIAPFEQDSLLLEVEFETYSEYKGSGLKTFYIDNPKFSKTIPCTIFLREGEELLVYLVELEKGKPSLGYCSRYFPLRYIKDKLEISILQYLKESELQYTSLHYPDRYSTDFFQSINSLETSAQDPEFAIFEIEVDQLNFITYSKMITGFNPQLDKQIIAIIEKSKWKFFHLIDEPIPHRVKFFLVLDKYELYNKKWRISGYMFM